MTFQKEIIINQCLLLVNCDLQRALHHPGSILYIFIKFAKLFWFYEIILEPKLEHSVHVVCELKIDELLTLPFATLIKFDKSFYLTPFLEVLRK